MHEMVFFFHFRVHFYLLYHFLSTTVFLLLIFQFSGVYRVQKLQCALLVYYDFCLSAISKPSAYGGHCEVARPFYDSFEVEVPAWQDHSKSKSVKAEELLPNQCCDSQHQQEQHGASAEEDGQVQSPRVDGVRHFEADRGRGGSRGHKSFAGQGVVW